VPRYVALMRAVNVGGRSVPMARLRDVLADLGLEGIGTYIQTGNAFFDSPRRDRAKLRAEIERALDDAFGFAVPTLLRTVSELEASLARDPFADSPPVGDAIRHVIVFIDRPLPRSAELPSTAPRDEFELLSATGGEVYVLLRRIAGRTGNPAAYIEKRYDRVATARWFHTTQKILDAASR